MSGARRSRRIRRTNLAKDVAPLESTIELFARIRAGDARAREILYARFYPILLRWAHGRLPTSKRGMSDTLDLVQQTLMRSFSRLDAFEPRGKGAFFGYLRKIYDRLVWDEKALPQSELDPNMPDSSPTRDPDYERQRLRAAIDKALAQLPERQAGAFELRMGYGLSNAQIGEFFGTSAAGAHMLVSRAIVRLGQVLCAKERVRNVRDVRKGG